MDIKYREKIQVNLIIIIKLEQNLLIQSKWEKLIKNVQDSHTPFLGDVKRIA